MLLTIWCQTPWLCHTLESQTYPSYKRTFLPFYLLLCRPSLLAGSGQAGLVLAPAADDSRLRTLGVFPHQPSCTTFGEQHSYLSWTLLAHILHPVHLVSILLAVIFFLWTFWLLAFPYNCSSFPHLSNWPVHSSGAGCSWGPAPMSN